MEQGDAWREERPKRKIVTTELVAGADFFHHLPCAAGRQRLEVWERVRVKLHPQHPKTKHNASECTEGCRGLGNLVNVYDFPV